MRPLTAEERDEVLALDAEKIAQDDPRDTMPEAMRKLEKIAAHHADGEGADGA